MKKYKLKLDYTEEELKELKRLGVAYDGPIAAVYRLGELVSSNDPFRCRNFRQSNNIEKWL